MGFGLVNRFTDYLYTPHRTTSNYSAIIDLHTLWLCPPCLLDRSFHSLKGMNWLFSCIAISWTFCLSTLPWIGIFNAHFCLNLNSLFDTVKFGILETGMRCIIVLYRVRFPVHPGYVWKFKINFYMTVTVSIN